MLEATAAAPAAAPLTGIGVGALCMIGPGLIGQLATTLGYEPLLVCRSVFDIVAFIIVWAVLGERGRPAGTAARQGAV